MLEIYLPCEALLAQSRKAKLTTMSLSPLIPFESVRMKGPKRFVLHFPSSRLRDFCVSQMIWLISLLKTTLKSKYALSVPPSLHQHLHRNPPADGIFWLIHSPTWSKRGCSSETPVSWCEQKGSQTGTKKPLLRGSAVHMAMLQNQWYHFGIGESTSRIEPQVGLSKVRGSHGF